MTLNSNKKRWTQNNCNVIALKFYFNKNQICCFSNSWASFHDSSISKINSSLYNRYITFITCNQVYTLFGTSVYIYGRMCVVCVFVCVCVVYVYGVHLPVSFTILDLVHTLWFVFFNLTLYIFHTQTYTLQTPSLFNSLFVCILIYTCVCVMQT